MAQRFQGGIRVETRDSVPACGPIVPRALSMMFTTYGP
jgi:hypothetical protein